MNNSLLREAIRFLVVEAIRSKKVGGESFNLEKFKQLRYNDEMLQYASNFLEELGVGSSRKAFILSTKKVIKIARNEAGKAQNEAETLIHETFKNDSGPMTVSKVLDWERSKYRWMIVEPTNTAGITPQMFEEIVGLNWEDFKLVLRDEKKISEVKANKETKNFLTKLQGIMNEAELLGGDILKLSHWGVTANRKLVLIDYGLTGGVREKHYMPDESTGKLRLRDPRTEKEKQDEDDMLAAEKAKKEAEIAAAAQRPNAPKYAAHKYVTGDD